MERSSRVDGAATRERLLDAAVALVARGGLPALTQRAVAAEAGLPATSVVYHLRTTIELRRATLEHAGARIGGLLTEHLLEATEHPDTVPTVCANFAVELVRERYAESLCVFVLLTAAAYNEELRPVATLLNERLARLLTLVVPPPMARALGAAVQGCILVALGTGSHDDLYTQVLMLVSQQTQHVRLA